jgi:endonuclease III
MKKAKVNYPKLLGLNLRKPEHRFKWFLASILFGARINATIAVKTYKEFEKYKLTTPQAILDAGWDFLVQVLDSGGYVRYDFKTATKLLEICEKLIKEYCNLEKLHQVSKDKKDLRKRLQEFKGIGPVTTRIFLDELKGIWSKV